LNQQRLCIQNITRRQFQRRKVIHLPTICRNIITQENTFPDQYVATIGVDFVNLSLENQDYQHRRKENQVADMGYCRTGKIQNTHQHLL